MESAVPSEGAGEESSDSKVAHDFKPFFTIVETKAKEQYYHPHVHYLFSDDDQEALSNALLRSYDNRLTPSRHEQDAGRTGSRATNAQAEEEGEEEERYVLVDIAADEKTVSSVNSLSPNWQTLKCSVAAAPTFGESYSEGEANLMLKIEGVERDSTDDIALSMNDLLQSPHTNDDPDDVDHLLEKLNTLATRFNEEISTLRRFIDDA